MTGSSQISAPVSARHLTIGAACGIAAALIWGAWPVISRLGMDRTLDVVDITALRFGVAGLILLPFALHRGLGSVLGKLGWGRAIVLSLCAGVPYVLAAVGALSFAPANHAGVIMPSTMLITATLGAWLLLGERPNRARIAGIGVIVAGLALIGWRGLSGGDAPGGGQLWIGHLLAMLAGGLWASYTLAARAWSVEPVPATLIVSVLSLLIVVPMYLIAGNGALWRAPLGEVAFQGLFQGVFAAILALFFYTRAVAVFGAGRGAIFASLVPGVAVVMAYPVLGETPGPHEIAGTAAVTLGMLWAIGLIRFRRPVSAGTG